MTENQVDEIKSVVVITVRVRNVRLEELIELQKQITDFANAWNTKDYNITVLPTTSYGVL